MLTQYGKLLNDQGGMQSQLYNHHGHRFFSAFKETIASKELQFLGVLVHYQVDGELLTSVLKKTASMDHTALRQQPLGNTQIKLHGYITSFTPTDVTNFI